MGQLSSTRFEPREKPPGSPARGHVSVHPPGMHLGKGLQPGVSSVLLDRWELQISSYLPNFSVSQRAIGTTSIWDGHTVRVTLPTPASFYFLVWGGGTSGGWWETTCFMNQKILRENASFFFFFFFLFSVK